MEEETLLLPPPAPRPAEVQATLSVHLSQAAKQSSRLKNDKNVSEPHWGCGKEPLVTPKIHKIWGELSAGQEALAALRSDV